MIVLYAAWTFVMSVACLVTWVIDRGLASGLVPYFAVAIVGCEVVRRLRHDHGRHRHHRRA